MQHGNNNDVYVHSAVPHPSDENKHSNNAELAAMNESVTLFKTFTRPTLLKQLCRIWHILPGLDSDLRSPREQVCG